MSDKLEKFEEEVRPLTGGDILRAPVEELNPSEVVEAYAIVKFLGDKVEGRRTELRKRIVEDEVIANAGKKTPSGGSSATIAGHKLQRKKTVKRFQNQSKIRQVMQERGLKESDVFDETQEIIIKKAVNPSKVERLVETGKLSSEEVESFHVVQWTVVVSASESLEALLEQADKPLLLGGKDE